MPATFTKFVLLARYIELKNVEDREDHLFPVSELFQLYQSFTPKFTDDELDRLWDLGLLFPDYKAEHWRDGWYVRSDTTCIVRMFVDGEEGRQELADGDVGNFEIRRPS